MMNSLSTLSRYKKRTSQLNKLVENKFYLELILSFLLTIIFGVFAIRPTVTTISTLVGDRQSLEQVRDQLKQKIVKLEAASEVYKRVEGQLVYLDVAYPSDPQIAIFMSQIDILAQESLVNLNGLNFEQFSFKQGAVTTGGQKQSLPWKQITFNISVSGDYPNLQEFINSLVNTRRIVLIDTVAISQDQPGALDTFASSTLEMSVRGRIIFN